MNAELKQKWVEALRSGRIAQANGVLRDQYGGMCCLGVLLDVVSPDGWSDTVEADDDDSTVCVSHKMGTEEGTFIPYLHRERFGLRGRVDLPSEPTTTIGHYLADMNDKGKTFAEIADWIEANIPAEESQS